MNAVQKPLTIVQLTAANLMRLKCVTIRPDGSLVVLGGQNSQGKSSVLAAIAMALGGGDEACSTPVRRGEERAEVVVDLGDLIVKRTFTAAGGSALQVSNREGLRYGSPQAVLDALCSRLSFDPLAFARAKPADQLKTLRELLGLDFTQADADRAQLYAERTAANKHARELAMRAEAMPQHEAPEEEFSAAEINEERERAIATNKANAASRAKAANLRNEMLGESQLADKFAEDERAILDKIAALQQQAAECARRSLEARERSVKLASEMADADESVRSLVDIDLAPFRQRLADVDIINKRVRDNRARARADADAAAASAKVAQLTAAIERIDAEKAARVAAATMPIAGLGFEGDTVTLNGLPLDVASQAERIKVSCAIGLALNPRLKILLIRDGSLLDHDSLRLVAEMAAAAGGQCWIERVEQDAETTVLIEDGMVREPAPAEAAAP
jgi:hypothetical protein